MHLEFYPVSVGENMLFRYFQYFWWLKQLNKIILNFGFGYVWNELNLVYQLVHLERS